MKLIQWLPATLAFATAPLWAQQQIQEQLIVTGSYTPLPVEQLSSTVSVLDRPMIAQLNKTNLADLLQAIPGVLVERQGGPGGLSVASIRGGESNYTVVMVDGVALNDPGNTRGGAFDLGNINVDSIERIEVVRGPQSAIYGADALAGVINIISLRPQQGHQQTLSVAGGDDGYQQAGVSALGATEAFDYAVQLRTRDSGEPVRGSEAEDDELNVRLGWQPAEAHRLSASYRYFDGERSSYPEQSGGPEFAQSPLLDYTDYTDKSAALGWQYQVAEQWKSHLQATLYQRDEVYSSPGIAPYTSVPANGAETEFERQQVSWINTVGQQGKLWANLGLEQRKEEGESIGYLDVGFPLPTDFSLKRTTDSGFVDVSGQVNEQLLLQGSLRYDDTDGFDSETSTKLGVRYQLSGQITLRANAGEGYKLPSFFALGHPLVGNADLVPEKVESWDIGVEWQPLERLFTSIDYFENIYRDPIDFDSDLFSNVNRERVDTSGVEWQAQWYSADNRLSLQGHATYTDIDVKDSVSVLTGRPQWRAGAALAYQINDAWRTSFDYQLVGEQYATSQHTGDTILRKLEDYQQLNGNLFWEITEAVEANFTIENMLHEEYQTAIGFPAPGVMWRVGLRWQL
jgi:vitamin B12 transporter